jgi:hypothetical protein
MKVNHALDKEDKETLKGLITYFGSTVSHLQEVKLDKLIYIAQLYHYANYGELLTKIPFFSLSRGPHAPAIRSVVNEQLESHAIYIKVVHSNIDPFNPCLIIRSHELEDKKLYTECLNTVREVLEDWGDRRFKDILNYTTRTIPFISTTYRDPIDLTKSQPSLSLSRVLSLPERIRIHQFVQAPEDAVDQDSGYSSDYCPVSINEVIEIYLALCGDLPGKIPSREHLGFNAQEIFEAFSTLNSKNKSGTGKHLTDIDKAAQLTDALLNSKSFRFLNHRVALKTGMLFLKRLGYSFQRNDLEENSTKAYDYKSIREWFDIVSVKKCRLQI